jgi:hypothetical protein
MVPSPSRCTLAATSPHSVVGCCERAEGSLAVLWRSGQCPTDLLGPQLAE